MYLRLYLVSEKLLKNTMSLEKSIYFHSIFLKLSKFSMKLSKPNINI